jgi:predicted ATP-dependent serine protease
MDEMYRCLVCGSRFPHHVPICSYCWASHSLALQPERARAAIDHEVELVSARELARTRWADAGIPAYSGLELRRGALVVVFGAAGSGKSTFAARALDSLGAPSLLVSVEEPAGPSLADRLARVGAKDDRLMVCSRATTDQIAAIVRQRKVVALGVDSVQRAMYEARELRHLLTVLPSLALVLAVSQVNRDGDVRGGEELAHEADVVIELDALRWTVRKSRYQPADASGDVLASSVKEDDRASA